WGSGGGRFAISLAARGESTNGGADGYCAASARRDDEGDPGVDRRGGATPRSPAFWAVQLLPNGRWQSPARPMRPPGCGGTWTAVPRLWRGRGQAGGPSGPASVAARGGIRRSGSSLRRLHGGHRHRTAPPRLAYGPPALATRPFVLSPRTASIDPD